MTAVAGAVLAGAVLAGAVLAGAVLAGAGQASAALAGASVCELTVAGQRIGVRTVSAARQPLTLFPSVGEYLAYDAGTYDGFQASGGRNRAYRDTIAAVSAGRCVLDVGTGRDALWAIAAARAGARRVLAVESAPAVAAQARDAVCRAGLSPVVTVLAGWSAGARLPERAEVCVSELIGNIASADQPASTPRCSP